MMVDRGSANDVYCLHSTSDRNGWPSFCHEAKACALSLCSPRGKLHKATCVRSSGLVLFLCLGKNGLPLKHPHHCYKIELYPLRCPHSKCAPPFMAANPNLAAQVAAFIPAPPVPRRDQRDACIRIFDRNHGRGDRMSGSPLYRKVHMDWTAGHVVAMRYWRMCLSDQEPDRFATEFGLPIQVQFMGPRPHVLYPHVIQRRPRGRRPNLTDITGTRYWLERACGYRTGCSGLGSPYFQYVVDRFAENGNTQNNIQLLDRLVQSECDRVQRLYNVFSSTSSTLTLYYTMADLNSWTPGARRSRGRPMHSLNRNLPTTTFHAQRMRATSGLSPQASQSCAS